MGISPDERVARAARGDHEALAELLEEVGPEVRRRLSISPLWQAAIEAADVMQVTYLEAFLRVDQLRGESTETFRAWLTRLADNNLRDAIRALECAKRPDPRRRVGHDRSESMASLMDEIGGVERTASQHIAEQEAEVALRAALVRLPRLYRLVVEQYDLEGRGIQEVAQELGRSPGAVYMLRARAHDRLRELLGSGSRYLGY
ncbi:MAG: sigma-70 family RNA polymerase sigma factor [Phycisphaerales bacterium]|nr:sigma-70 family RNA polymerase sigma factor [Phycisphaerales bacterium]